MKRPILKNKYYYLYSFSSTSREGIKLKTLKKDLERGVKHINSQAYMTFNTSGITRYDIKFLEQLEKLLFLNGKSAEMIYQKNSYKLTVKTHEGYTIVFYGVSGGFYGEGTRGCHDVLKAFGFNEAQCNKPFKHENFKVIRN